MKTTLSKPNSLSHPSGACRQGPSLPRRPAAHGQQVGFSSPRAIPYAIKLGIALQLTNILRDVAEDWRAFMQFQIRRTRHLANQQSRLVPSGYLSISSHPMPDTVSQRISIGIRTQKKTPGTREPQGSQLHIHPLTAQRLGTRSRIQRGPPAPGPTQTAPPAAQSPPG
ncbi:MAG: squalene/phytoene synthase family protein [Anaerolineae bacterium]